MHSLVVQGLCALQEMHKPRVDDVFADDSIVLRDLAEGLRRHDSELADHLARCGRKDENTDARTTCEIFKPLLNNMFLDVLATDMCLYIWDQCLILGFDVAVPKFGVCILLVLRERLLECHNLEHLRDTVSKHAKNLTTHTLIRKMEETFIVEIREKRQSPLRNLSVWAQSA